MLRVDELRREDEELACVFAAETGRLLPLLAGTLGAAAAAGRSIANVVVVTATPFRSCALATWSATVIDCRFETDERTVFPAELLITDELTLVLL
eukprot:m.244856 g.244856  ORF g.244856 m.244856 type:complete len:95 (+) comp175439_c0_seq1:89-373(+)